jgi:putative transposase
VRKTWAPVGRTPIFRHRYSRDRISAISAVTVSPSRKRLGLYFRFHTINITGVEVIAFLRHLLRHVRAPMVLLWDGGTIHRRTIVKEFLRHNRRLHVHRFPAYAPELNPDEFVWTQAKNSLANGAPKDVVELGRRLRHTMHRIRNSQRLLWSCIHASELPWP